MGKVLYPPYIMDENWRDRIIFLAGPIQGAKNWQARAIKIIQRLDDNITIACPRRPITIDRNNFTIDDYNQQVDWETHFLRQAGLKWKNRGVIMFWLAKEFEHNCRRAYAQTSRFELAEWKLRHERDGTKLVIGIEPGFTGARYIQRRMGQDCPRIKIFSSLKNTCKQAVELFHQ